MIRGMRLIALVTLATLGGCAATTPTQSAAVAAIDCPMRDTAYSIDAPLIDVLLKPEAMAVLERAAPGISARIPPRFASTEGPSFAAILTLRLAGGLAGLQAEQLEHVDSELRALPITSADREARCARYDIDQPQVDLPNNGRPRILLFEKMTGFRDGPSVEAAHQAFVEMAARNNWTLVSTESGGAITTNSLRRFDLVIWNNVSGDVLTLTQRAALKAYMEGGGGFVAIHGSGGDPVYFWDWYADTLIGARFAGHPMNPQFQEARIVVPGAPSPIGRDLAPGWTMTDEWYSFRTNPRDSGATIIASLDESTYSPEGAGMGGGSLRMGADHPIAWSNCIENGRAFYSAIGHRPETYADPHYVRLLEQAMTWAMDRTQC